MSYTALYRKFRPNKFEDVKGQDHIVTTLKNQIHMDRIGHAYLFCGTRGTGKTTIAKLFAKAINCEHPQDGDPCMECESCRSIMDGNSMNVIEIDAASNNGVENIRQIIEEVAYPPTQGRYKVYIIDEVHMLSIGAFNALLKTLEEPPSYVVFILATTEAHKLPITILSRCQRYDFKRISVEDISNRLQELLAIEKEEAEESAIRYVAKMADGSLRDGLSLLDQCLAFNYGKKLTYDMVLDVLGAVDNEVFSRLLRTVISTDVGKAMKILEEVIMQGRELTQFVTDFTWYLRNLLLAKTSDDISGVVDMSEDNLKRLKEESEMLDADEIVRYIRVFSELSGQIKYANNKRVLVEVAVIKLCRPMMEWKEDTILSRIRELEKKIENGVTVVQNVEVSSEVQHSEPVKKVPLPPSLPEEVQDVVNNRKKIIALLGHPLRECLQNSRLSVSEAGELLIVTCESLSKAYLVEAENASEHVETLADCISNAIKKQIKIRVVSVDNERQAESQYADISSMIDMPIEVEEN